MEAETASNVIQFPTVWLSTQCYTDRHGKCGTKLCECKCHKSAA